MKILKEIEDGAKVGEVADKHGTSGQVVRRWHLEREKIERQIKEDHRGAKKQVENKKDGLKRIKKGIRAFYDINRTMPKDLILPITGKFC